MCDGSPKLDCSQLTVSPLPAKSLSASPHNPLFGFLNVYKPQGITSHDVVARLRRLTKIRQSVRNSCKEKQNVLTKIQDSAILVSEKIHCL